MLTKEVRQLLKDTGLKSSDQYPYCIKVHKPYGQLDVVLRWCRSRFKNGSWGWRIETMPSADYNGEYNFYFDQEPDAFEFALRWSN